MRISGRCFILFCILLISLTGCAQKPPKAYRVGILSGASAFFEIKDGFKARMSELGYIEGKNILYDAHDLNEDRAAEQRVLKKFVGDKVDLIFAYPTEAALSAKSAARGTKIPVLFAMGTIEGTGLVESVRHPGDNITGVRFNGPDVIVKGLEVFLALVPGAKRIWIIHDKDYPAGASSMEALRAFASSKGITLIEDHIGSLEELNNLLEGRAGAGDIDIDAINLIPDVITLSPDGFAMIMKFSLEHKVPVVGGAAFAVREGAVLTTIPDNIEIGRLAAPLADRIFRGIPAGTIPVVTPQALLRVNYKAIKEMGLKVNDAILNEADEIIR